ncbi:MAG: hypothetical protein ABJO28_08770 [Maribacter dokdonensis]
MKESTVRRAIYLTPKNDEKIKQFHKNMGMGYSAIFNYILNRIEFNHE